MCWLSGEGFLASLQRRGRLVFLGGEAGAGKTTLAASALAAAPGGAEVRRGACDNITAAEALGPILEAQPELAAAAGGWGSSREDREHAPCAARAGGGFL
jgi:MoxR-like ATPase